STANNGRASRSIHRELRGVAEKRRACEQESWQRTKKDARSRSGQQLGPPQAAGTVEQQVDGETQRDECKSADRENKPGGRGRREKRLSIAFAGGTRHKDESDDERGGGGRGADCHAEARREQRRQLPTPELDARGNIEPPVSQDVSHRP